MLEAMQGIATCFLMAFLLRVAFAASTLVSVDDHLCVEERRTVFCLSFIKQDILQSNLMLLTPLQQLALEVHFFVCQLVDVYKAAHYLLPDEGLAMTVSSVKVDGAYECFEGVTCEVAVVRLVVLVAANELVETYLCCESSQRFSLHYLASSIRQETFSLTWEVMIDYLSHDCIEYCVAQELESFVVKRRATLAMSEHRLVHQSFLIEAYLMWVEAQHITKSATKFPVLAEG